MMRDRDDLLLIPPKRELLMPRRDAMFSMAAMFGALSARGYGYGGGLAARTYATLNPSDKSANITLSGGNLTAASSTIDHCLVRATISKSTGKWYYEFLASSLSSTLQVAHFGWAKSTLPTNDYVGQTNDGWDTCGGPTPTNAHNASSAGSAGTPVGFTTNDYMNCAWDAGAGSLWVGKNGTYISGDPAAGTSPTWSSVSGTLFPALSLYCFSGSVTIIANFGATAFNNTVPSGFNAGVFS